MAVVPRRPLFVLCMCFTGIAVVGIVLGIIIKHDSGSDGNGGLNEETTCTVVAGTLDVNVGGDDNGCRAHVDVRFRTAQGSRVHSVAWSGILERIYGPCDAARAFAARFGSAVDRIAPCWYHPANAHLVRLWGAAAAGLVVPGDDSADPTRTALTVLLISGIVGGALLIALRCGVFGAWQPFWQSQEDAALPTEPVVVGDLRRKYAVGVAAPPLPLAAAGGSAADADAPGRAEGGAPAPALVGQIGKEGFASVPPHLAAACAPAPHHTPSGPAPFPTAAPARSPWAPPPPPPWATPPYAS
eukprot:TRINITY_DN65298_c0_g1_i1.p1 TRINITY_DN65298_c0_g1~~TRINITY_DN65298_c0_g1_i1.p1  ORF type:complete len:320 (+),score=93.82 TRINITY_DN65298_c0_g1_i1:62-961(+)